MRAMIVRAPGGLDRLELADLRDPAAPGPGQVAVRIRASSLNYHDYVVALGQVPLDGDRIPMSDGAGEITAVGEGVTEFAVGDRVMSTFYANWPDGESGNRRLQIYGESLDGFACEQVVAPAVNFTRIPKNYSWIEAATLPCAALTAWRALAVESTTKPGDQVLVLGSGGVSLFALQFAKAMGARVIATSSSDEKLERLSALGADATVNYRREPDWGNAVRKLSDGGVDHVIDVGGALTLPQSIMAARRNSQITLIGIMAGDSGPIPTTLFMTKQLRLVGITVGNRKHQQEMVAGIDAIGLKPVIDKVFPLEGLAEAFRHQGAGSHFGKVAVELN